MKTLPVATTPGWLSMPPKAAKCGFQSTASCSGQSVPLSHRVWQLPAVLACFTMISFKTTYGDRPGVQLRYECCDCKLDSPPNVSFPRASRGQFTADNPPTQNFFQQQAERACETMIKAHRKCHPALPAFEILNASIDESAESEMSAGDLTTSALQNPDSKNEPASDFDEHTPMDTEIQPAPATASRPSPVHSPTPSPAPSTIPAPSTNPVSSSTAQFSTPSVQQWSCAACTFCNKPGRF